MHEKDEVTILRSTVYPWLCLRIGNGQTCRFWSDNWSPFGCISDFLNLPPSSRLGISRTATLSDLNENGNWLLHAARSEEQVQIQVYLSRYLSTIFLSEEEDQYEWIIDGSRSTTFSTGAVYRELKHHNPVVSWSKTVWCPRGTPKHSFLAWLFVLNRYPTRDRLLSWGLNTLSSCLLCNSADKSRNHLFFYCCYFDRFGT